MRRELSSAAISHKARISAGDGHKEKARTTVDPY